MERLRPLADPPLPGELLGRGLAAGRLQVDPLKHAPRRGRPRRWLYAAAGEPGTLVGAAVVDLGALHLAFAWAHVDGTTGVWERRLVRGAWLGTRSEDGAHAQGRDSTVVLDGDGSLHLDVPTTAGRLLAEVDASTALPAVLVTRTPRGGWNATEKTAGYAVAGGIRLGERDITFSDEAGGWRDWTAGRQDRQTTWRWAAGAGRADDGGRVGLNVSTGMNRQEAGEDVVWWDGTPYALEVSQLGPVGDDPAGPWQLTGPGWELAFAPAGVRRADERLLVARSSYIQPIGTFQGQLPGPDGAPVAVTLAGVTEDHLAVW